MGGSVSPAFHEAAILPTAVAMVPSAPAICRAPFGPVESVPFYGVEIESSALGTKGGPRTDRDGRVLDVDGDPIAGLYAAGNVMANPTGMVYGGAGATLAVAGVWGMAAGRAAVRDRAASPPSS